MEFMTAQQAAKVWGTSVRTVQVLCRDGRVTGADQWGKTWMIPKDAQKPADKRKRQRETRELKLKMPRHSPLLFMTDLYHKAGEADRCIASIESPYVADLMQAWLFYHQGNIPRAIELARPLRYVEADNCGIMSVGILLVACSLWQGDLGLWMEGRSHIKSAKCINEMDQALQLMSFATTDEGLLDNSQFPEWFQKGQFEYLPEDSLPAAWFYYAKFLYISAWELATGKVSYKNMEGLGLMRTLPYLMEPLIVQAKVVKSIYAEICLRGLCAKVYHDLGEYDQAIAHLDIAISLALPDRLYGVLAELRNMVAILLDERLECIDPVMAKEIRTAQKSMLSGFSKMTQALRNVQLVTTLSPREQEVAQLAALGFSNLEISERLKLSVSSVKAIVAMIMNKTGTQKRSEFIKFII